MLYCTGTVSIEGRSPRCEYAQKMMKWSAADLNLITSIDSCTQRPSSRLRLIMVTFVGTISVEVPAMTDDQIEEQIRRGTSDAQLLLVMDRKRACTLLAQQQIANPLRGFTQLPPATLQEVYDDAFFKKLEERLTLCC
jgi:hypothetical protein